MVSFARRLRKTATIAEDRLWERLRRSQPQAQNSSVKFRSTDTSWISIAMPPGSRSTPGCDPGNGKQHGWQDAYDEKRTKALEAAGAHVMRFGNHEVLDDLDEVLRRIGAELRLPFG